MLASAAMRLLLLKRALVWSALAGSVGCGAHAPKPVPVAPPSEAEVAPARIADEAFAGSVHALLLDRENGPGRPQLLAGVIGTQLAHASERFDSGFQERGLSTLRGAMYSLRPGELRPELLAGHDALLEAAYGHVAPRGEEGVAYALLKLRRSILKEGSPARLSVDEQLHALERWLAETKTGSPLEITGHDQRVLVSRALLEPSIEAHDAAREATMAWIEQAVVFSEDAKGAFARPKREETVEAFRAFRSGAKTLIALSLRHGDANAALTDIERSPARRMISEELYERLRRAASGGGANEIRALLSTWIDESSDREDQRQDPEISLDSELFRAAAWGMALEVLRRDPTALDASMPVALMAAQLGMPETSPLFVLEGVEKRPEPPILSAAYQVTAQAIASEFGSDDLASARRIFRSAEKLLALSSKPELQGKLQPSAGQVRVTMAMVETAAGELSAARSLLETAVREEPASEIWLMLAAIDRQLGKTRDALDHLDRASALLKSKPEPLALGEVHLARYDLLRDSGQDDESAPELAHALEAALRAKANAKNGSARAEAEHLLAKILERYGDFKGAARAIDRAFAAAAEDKRRTAAIAIDSAARALVRRDVDSARHALTRAMEAQLREDDLVYIALWLSLAEKETKTKPDGTATKALSNVQDSRWVGRLASWGLGKLKDQELIEAARTPHQKTEALFYAAMARRIAGELRESEASLRDIAKSANIDLVEVRIAREIVNPPKPLPGGLPKGAKIP